MEDPSVGAPLRSELVDQERQRRREIIQVHRLPFFQYPRGSAHPVRGRVSHLHDANIAHGARQAAW